MAYKDHPPRNRPRNMNRKTSKATESEIVSFLANSQTSEGDASDRFGVDSCDVIEIMLEHNYERCAGCDIWWPTFNLYESKCGMDYRCNDCLKDE